VTSRTRAGYHATLAAHARIARALAISRVIGSAPVERRHALRALAGALFALSLPEAPRAQPPPSDLEEIVITGARQRELAKPDPLPVTSFDQAALDTLGIADLTSLQAFVPSLHIGRYGSVLIVTLRGFGLENVTPGAVASVCLEQDGIPICGARAAVSMLYDLESLDVHRGPQGISGGRSMSGGKLALRSRMPIPELDAGGDFQYGTRNQIISRGYFNLPLAGDRLIARVSAVHEDRDGYQRNLVTGRSRDAADDADDFALRAQLAAVPLDPLHLRLIGGIAAQGGVGFGLTLLSRDQLIAPASRCPDDGARDGSVCPASRLPPDGRLRSSTDPRNSYADEVGSRDNDQAHATGIAELDVPELPLLGDTRLALTLGWRRNRVDEVRDFDGTNLDLSVEELAFSEDQRVFEASWADRTREHPIWKLGFFYDHERVRVNYRAQEGNIREDVPLRFVSSLTSIGTKEVAGYLDLRLPLADDAFALLGVRATRSARDAIEGSARSFSPLLGARPALRAPLEEVWKNYSPRVGVEVEFAPDSVLTATLTWGFKTGGFAIGTGANASARVFDPEELWSLEVHSENRFFDDRLELDAGLFWSDYDNYQNCFTRAASFDCRVGSATVYGAELELAAEPYPGLRLDGNLDYLHARIDELVSLDPTLRLGAPGFGSENDLAGQRLPRAPSFSATGGLQVEIDLGRYGALTPRAQLRYQSRTYFEAYNHPDFAQDPYLEIDARLTWTSRDGRFTLTAIGENLGDVEVISNIFIGPIFSESPVFGAYLPPRSFALRAGFQF
jgi:iron complex outermembrane receptor protein